MLSVIKRVSPRKESESHSDKKTKRQSEKYKAREESPELEYYHKGKKHDKNSSKRHKRSKEDESSPTHKRSKEDESFPRHKRSKEDNSSPDSFQRSKEIESSPKRKKRSKEDGTSPIRRRQKEGYSSPISKRTKDDDSSPISKRTRDDSSPISRRAKGGDSPPISRRAKGDDSSPISRRAKGGDGSPMDRKTKTSSTKKHRHDEKTERNNFEKEFRSDENSRSSRTEKNVYFEENQNHRNRQDKISDERSENNRENAYDKRGDDFEKEFRNKDARSKSSKTEKRKHDHDERNIREDSSPNKESYEKSNRGSRTSEIRKGGDNEQRSQKQTIDSSPNTQENETNEPLSKRMKMGNINLKTGGAYIPPARLRMMQDQIQDKGSEEYQRIAWEALKKSIVGMTNKINSSNIAEIVPELFKENIIRGRGVLIRAIMQAQAASPTFTRVYAALVAIINSKFPEIGELVLKRLIVQYKRGLRRNGKTVCMTAARFLAHLLNQEVAHEVLILEMVTHLLEMPTDDSVEVAIATLKECGKKLTELCAKGMGAITQRVRDVLHDGKIDARVRYMIEVYFAIQKEGYKDFEIIPPELDLVEEDDKCTHLINLDDALDSQEMLNIFKFDPNYEENEEKYKAVVKEILGDGSDEEGSDEESGSGDDEEEDEEAKAAENQLIIDMTETNIVVLRRKIYLIIQSSLDFEECAHKLLKLELKPGQILEMCYMILDCCAQQRTYEKFFGLLAQRFCQMNKIYVDPFTEIFENSYKTIHRLETNKLRNVAKFFAHLLYTDAISWMVLANIKLNEDDTSSSSRIFIKILFQELCEYMGLTKLNERVKDITLQEAFEGLFPRDHPHNTRFAINFFTSIGLGGLTDELREHLKNLPKNQMPIPQPEAEASASSSSESSSSSSSSSSCSADVNKFYH